MSLFSNVVGHGNSFPFLNPVFRRVKYIRGGGVAGGPRATLPCGDLNLINKTAWQKFNLITFEKERESRFGSTCKERKV
jgi:hypothetical protein